MIEKLLIITIHMLDVLLSLYQYNKITLEDLKKHADVKLSFIIDHIEQINNSIIRNYAYNIVKQYQLLISTNIKIDDI